MYKKDDFYGDFKNNPIKDGYHAGNQNKPYINRPISQIFCTFVFKSRRLFPKQERYLQPVITQYFVSYTSEIWA